MTVDGREERGEAQWAEQKLSPAIAFHTWQPMRLWCFDGSLQFNFAQVTLFARAACDEVELVTSQSPAD